MGDEEVKTADVVITEETTKVVNEVKKVIESAVTGVDLTVAQPVITEVATVATTVISEGVKSLGLKMVTESSLTEDQKKLATLIYDGASKAVKGFIADKSVNSTLKITLTLGEVIKHVESAKVDGHSPNGADKKAVVIELGRILIKELIADEAQEKEIVAVYDIFAERTLEAMIGVSKVVNTVIQEVATSCCPGFLSFFRKSSQ